MITTSIHLKYAKSAQSQWKMSMVNALQKENFRSDVPEFFENFIQEGIVAGTDRHIRLVLKLYRILKSIQYGDLKGIHARYYNNALPNVLLTLELEKEGTAEIMINLYAPDGKIELTSTRGIGLFDPFEKDVQVEFKYAQPGILKPAPKYFYVIDISKLDTLPVFENHRDVLDNIKQLHELAQEISKEVLK